ncbi:alpha/beta hydrolase family protein [Rhizomonospora bruguierae]|uniref:alpha/beta hydrolase family protein n=1 Tax=Rhizomonospora bruguierae TaxID=1581705 RepID=UPI001BCDAA14|nr:hypothetical protein [Micromonospora sp. NBRC 107566]
MRPLEITLIVANVVALLLLAIPAPGRARWLRHSALITIPVAGAQLLIEGSRWQMVPAYALAGLFLLRWLVPAGKPADTPGARHWTRRLATTVGVSLAVLGLAISAALPILFPVFHFRTPSGPYGIGTVTYHWVDGNRPEIFTADSTDHRELMAQVWYPATKVPSAKHAPYVQDADKVGKALARMLQQPSFIFDHLRYITTNAVPSAPVADGAPSYPVLVFLHGLGGYRSHNTFQVEELVSHGYIVVGFDMPYAAASVVFPDGRQAVGRSRDEMFPLIRASWARVDPAPTLNGQIYEDGIARYLAQDVSFALDQLTTLNRADPILAGRLDLQRAGVLGVSLGGVIGPEACRMDPRLRACLMLDAPVPTDVVREGLRQPSMWITRDADTMRREGWPQSEIDEHHDSMRATYESLPGDGYFVQVPGMFHVNFTDYPVVSPLLPSLGITGPIDGSRGHDIINAYSRAFFDRELKGQPAALLDGPANQYPEVLFETRRP